MIDWLMNKSAWALSDIGKIKAFDPAATKQLFCFALNVQEGCRLPPECQMHAVLEAMCDERYSDCGSRLHGLVLGGHAIAIDGRVNWVVIGEIEVVVEGKKVVAVKHRRSGYEEKVDQELSIDDSFTLRDNHCLAKATFVKGVRRYKALDMFVSTSKPHAMRPWQTGNSDLKAMVAKHAQLAKDSQTATPSSQTEAEKKAAFEAPIKEKQREATKRAREALAKAKSDRDNKKRLSIGQASAS